MPRVSKLDARKQWIIGSVSPKGEVIIDQGAVKAIRNGKSLSPAGVKKISGVFEKGDHVLVKYQNDISIYWSQIMVALFTYTKLKTGAEYIGGYFGIQKLILVDNL